jgi:hypothetical protein
MKIDEWFSREKRGVAIGKISRDRLVPTKDRL